MGILKNFLKARKTFATLVLGFFLMNIGMLPLSVQAATDTTKPVVRILSPITNTTITGSGMTTVIVTATDNVGVVGVQLLEDNIPLGSELTGSLTYTKSVNLYKTPDGTHILSAVARDAAGNTATSTINIKTKTPVALPTINSFTATPTSIVKGASSTLNWSVTGATSISINQGVGTMTGTSIQVHPTVTTTYTLTAKNAGGTKTATATVNVALPPAPTINSFTATPTSIVKGDASTLNWSVTGATSISINQGVGIMTGTTVQVHPTTSTTYTLTAKNATGTKTATVTIGVTLPPPPTILSFSASSGSVVKGQSSTLNWSVSGATSISINQAIGTMTGSSTMVLPNATTVYTLTAKNAGGSTTATTTVNVTLPPPPPVIPGNMILNPSFTDGTGSTPQYWNQGGWGTNNAIFTYPVTGYDSSAGASVSITSYTDGDAKWYFNDVAINPAEQYTFSDYYKSDVSTTIYARYLLADNSYSYVYIGSALASSTWKQFKSTIQPPTGTLSVTIFHALESTGTLTVDNYSLITGAQSGPDANSFDKGYVTLSFDDGWSSMYDYVLPIFQTSGIKGTFYIISQYMLHSNVNIFTDPTASSDETIVSNSQGTSWNTLYTDSTQHTFNFTDLYTSTGASVVEVSYVPQGGTGTVTTTVGSLPAASTGAIAQISFTLPVISSPISISHHTVSASDTLSLTGAILLQPTGYMGTEEVRSILNAGNEIGDHTQTHVDVSTLTPAQATQEIVGARNDLVGALNTTIDTFAYPYGSYNATSLQILKNNGFIGARSTEPGYVTKATDKYNLVMQEVNNATTLTQIKSWIDTANTNKQWLILMFHQVDYSNQQYATTPDILQGIANYLSTSGTPAITVHQGLQMIP